MIKINFNQVIKIGTNPWIQLKTFSGAIGLYKPSIIADTLNITPKIIACKWNTVYAVVHSGDSYKLNRSCI